MAHTKDYKDEEDFGNHMGSPEISTAEYEKTRLMDSHDFSRPPTTSSPSARSNCAILLLSISNVISIAIVLFLFIRTTPGAETSQTPTTVIYPPRPNWFPPQIAVSKVLKEDELYQRAPDPESESAWDKLLPLGRGQVIIHNETALPEMPGLNQSLPEQTAWVAVTHQLHCLYSTKHSFYQLLNHKPSDPPVEPNMEHLNHCWEYLRQGLMCNADVTLEWHKYGEHAGTGWGYQHQCKDWDAIVAWVEHHRLTNDYGIIRGGGQRIPLTEPPV